MSASSTQISKHVLVGFAGVSALASAGCSKLPGEYDGWVDIEAAPQGNVKKSSHDRGHVSIHKATSGKAVFLVDVKSPAIDHCTISVYSETKGYWTAGFANANDCVLAGGAGAFPTGLGAGQDPSKDGKLKIAMHSIDGIDPSIPGVQGSSTLTFDGERAH